MVEKVIKMAKSNRQHDNSCTDTYALHPVAASVTVAPFLVLAKATIKNITLNLQCSSNTKKDVQV